MYGIEHVWGWILLGLLGLNANLRNAVQAKGQDLWNIARGTAAWSLRILKNYWLCGLLWILVGLFPFMVIGLRVPFCRAIVLAVLIVWFAVLVLVLRGIANALAGIRDIPAVKRKQSDGTEVEIVPPIPLDGIGSALADSLRFGSKPILYIIGLLGNGILMTLSLPNIPGTVAMFILGVFVVRTAVGAYHDKPFSMKHFYVYMTICIIAFVIRMTPNANSFLGENWRSFAGYLGGQSHQWNVNNEMSRRFSSQRYLNHWGLSARDQIPIFSTDGRALTIYEVDRLLDRIYEEIVLVIDLKAKLPKSLRGKIAGIEFSLIQESPGAIRSRYYVPRRCVDAETRKPAEILQAVVQDRRERVIAEAAAGYARLRIWQVVSNIAQFWPYRPGTTDVGTMVRPPIGSCWEVIKEIPAASLPAGVPRVGARFLEVQNLKDPAQKGILRGLGGGEIPNPFGYGL